MVDGQYLICQAWVSSWMNTCPGTVIPYSGKSGCVIGESYPAPPIFTRIEPSTDGIVKGMPPRPMRFVSTIRSVGSVSPKTAAAKVFSAPLISRLFKIWLPTGVPPIRAGMIMVGPVSSAIPPATPRPTIPPGPAHCQPARVPNSDPRKITPATGPRTMLAARNSHQSTTRSVYAPSTPLISYDFEATIDADWMSAHWLATVCETMGSSHSNLLGPMSSFPLTSPVFCAATLSNPFDERTTARTRNLYDARPLACMCPRNWQLPVLVSTSSACPPSAVPAGVPIG